MRRGVSVIEVVVVIAIVVILFGLLMPAVQKVRESASRARCANNLRQVGLAVQNYESARGQMPVGGYQFECDNYGGGWLSQVAPWCELSRQIEDAPKLVFCPSRRAPVSRVHGVLRGLCDYAAVVPGPRGGWVEEGRESVRPTQFPRGRSQTAMVSEKRLGPPYGDCPQDDQGWSNGGFDNDIVVYSITPPASDSFDADPWGWRAGSAHREGLNVGRCDGSVAFVAYTVDPAVWETMARR